MAYVHLFAQQLICLDNHWAILIFMGWSYNNVYQGLSAVDWSYILCTGLLVIYQVQQVISQFINHSFAGLGGDNI